MLVTGLSLLINMFIFSAVTRCFTTPQTAATTTSQTAATIRIKMVDPYTGASLANQTFSLMIPIDDHSLIGAGIQHTPHDYKTDAAGWMTIPAPQFKYGSGIAQDSDTLMERLPDGSWLGKPLSLKNDFKIKSGIAALSSADLTTRFVTGFKLWALEINTGENKFTEGEKLLLKTHERKINQVFFASAVKFLKTGNKGIRRDIFSFVATVLAYAGGAKELGGTNAEPGNSAWPNKIRIPAPVVAGIIENLRDPDKNLRAVMLGVISVNPGKPAQATIAAVKRLLNDDDAEIRKLARMTLDTWKIAT
jgi:hypothetical protein